MRIITAIIAIHILTAIFNAVMMRARLKERNYEFSFTTAFIPLIFHPWRNFWALIGHFFMPHIVEQATDATIEKFEKSE